ncbi:hypothetical protein [Lysobacter enzymogenes]|uniref:hypothetical protein n=1 Tax=Lysobacter enzymogenes TaxID=69 RepID=UPI0009CB648C|nr:hypothetical protein [Lysobacter enzymogenes]UZW60323.1 hypothetical protein BV903_024150 [Lysobacter enzymogenes]
MRFPVLALFALCPSVAYASDKAYACDLGDVGAPQVVRVTKAGKLADTYIYYLRQGDGAALPLLGGEAEDSRGSGLRIECVDGKHRALAVFGEFMSAGYPQGWVMIYDPAKRSFERFGFAERAPLGWLYLGAQDSLLVFAPGGRLETERRYLVYRFAVGAGQDSTETIVDTLPKAEGYEVVKIDW